MTLSQLITKYAKDGYSIVHKRQNGKVTFYAEKNGEVIDLSKKEGKNG